MPPGQEVKYGSGHGINGISNIRTLYYLHLYSFQHSFSNRNYIPKKLYDKPNSHSCKNSNKVWYLNSLFSEETENIDLLSYQFYRDNSILLVVTLTGPNYHPNLVDFSLLTFNGNSWNCVVLSCWYWDIPVSSSADLLSKEKLS